MIWPGWVAERRKKDSCGPLTLDFRCPGLFLAFGLFPLPPALGLGVPFVEGHTSPSAPGLKTAVIEPPEDAGSGLTVWGRGVTFYSFLLCP